MPPYRISAEEMDLLGSLEPEDDEGPEAVAELEDLGKEARAFLESHSWCSEVLEGYIDRGFQLCAVFYFRMRRQEPDEESDAWVIAGDLSPAYVPTDRCPNGAWALKTYVDKMEEWSEAVLADRSVDHLIPVVYRSTLMPVGRSKRVAEMMTSRVKAIRENMLCDWTDELAEVSDADGKEASP